MSCRELIEWSSIDKHVILCRISLGKFLSASISPPSISSLTITTLFIGALLIKFIKEKLHCTIKAIVPTHFHSDCLGGLAAFHKLNIPSFANFSTIELTKENNVVIPQNGFKDALKLSLGKTYAIVKYFGEGHTKDNVVGYFPSENILFGGCLIKELEATKGYLGDANIAQWSNTVDRIKKQYPNIKIVIPGHGAIGGSELLDYTIKLFKSK